MIETTVFNLMLAFFATHELDAVDKHEWRLLYGFRRMNERHARIAFILLHIPLFAGIFALAYSNSPGFTSYSRISIDVFAIVHLFLHWRLHRHPENRFSWPISYIPIIGAALFGAVHLLTLIAQLVE